VGTKEVELEDDVYVGLAVDAAKNSNNIDNYDTAVFSDVSTTMERSGGVEDAEDPEEPEEPEDPEVIFEDDLSEATDDSTTPECMELTDDHSKPMYMMRDG